MNSACNSATDNADVLLRAKAVLAYPGGYGSLAPVVDTGAEAAQVILEFHEDGGRW